jgi:hypothetical protein
MGALKRSEIEIMIVKNNHKKITVAVVIIIIFILALSVNSYKSFLENNLKNAVKTAAMSAVNENSVPTTNNIMMISNASDVQKDFILKLQKQLKYWPKVSYSLQSVHVFEEIDKGKTPPSGFTQTVPGPSVYFALTMEYHHLKLPLHIIIVPKGHIG